MKKNFLVYKIGLAVLGVFVIGLAIFVILQANDTKQDTISDKAANKIAEKLNGYITTSNNIPDSLSQIGQTAVPASITYSKIDGKSYKFCVTYKTASSGFDASDAVFNAATGNTVDTTPPEYSNNSSLYISTTHKKGANCQTIKPYLNTLNICTGPNATFSGGSCYDYDYGTNSLGQTPKQQASASGNQSSACGTNKYATHYSGTIVSIDTADGSTLVPTADQKIIIKVRQAGSGQSGAQTITISPAGTAPESEFFNVYDSTCTAREASSMKYGDNISVFLDNADQNMPNSIIDFSR